MQCIVKTFIILICRENHHKNISSLFFVCLCCLRISDDVFYYLYSCVTYSINNFFIKTIRVVFKITSNGYSTFRFVSKYSINTNALKNVLQWIVKIPYYFIHIFIYYWWQQLFKNNFGFYWVLNCFNIKWNRKTFLTIIYLLIYYWWQHLLKNYFNLLNMSGYLIALIWDGAKRK